jgi:hypothetical protein
MIKLLLRLQIVNFEDFGDTIKLEMLNFKKFRLQKLILNIG